MKTFRLLALSVLAASTSLHAWVRDGLAPWADNTTVVLNVHNVRVPSFRSGVTWLATVQQAAAAWNPNMDRVQLSVVTASGAPGDSNEVNDVFFNPTIYGDSFGTSTLAVAISSSLGSRRVESDVLVNTAIRWDVYDGNMRSQESDLRRVLTHELGHSLGLSHPDEASPRQFVFSLMNSSYGNVDRLQSDDKLGIGNLYGFTVSNPSPGPTISGHPQAASVFVGDPLTLTVTATPSTSTYAWLKDDAPTGDTTATFSRSQAALSDAGTYRVRVTSASVSTLSNPAVVTVTTHPAEALLPGSTGTNWSSWRNLPWFGWFHASRAPWILHEDLGWLRLSGSATTGLYAYHPTMGWLWTRSNLYPRLYNYRSASWTYFATDANGTKWIYTYSTRSWARL